MPPPRKSQGQKLAPRSDVGQSAERVKRHAEGVSIRSPVTTPAPPAVTAPATITFQLTTPNRSNFVIRVGLIGDYDAAVLAHQAIPRALSLAADSLGTIVNGEWLATDTITKDAQVSEFDALWCVPASPYRSTEGALRAIRFAREHGRPFLGTCGGFQHAIIEYARSVLGWNDAEHGETAPNAERAVITPLACALVEASDEIFLLPGSRLAKAYDRLEAEEGYHCRYGLNADFQTALLSGPLRVAAVDASQEVRAVELDDHPFFVATLFQPERAAMAGRVPAIVRAFVAAASQAP